MSLIENHHDTTNIQQEEDADFLYAMQLATSLVLPMCMHVAMELDVFEIIAKAGPGAQVSPKDIVSQLPTENPNASIMLDRLLRVLATHSVLTSALVTNDNGPAERLYGLGSVCKYFVKNEEGGSITPLTLFMQDKVSRESWYYFKDAFLHGGVPFNKAHGMTIFEYPGIDSRFNKLLNSGMYNHTLLFMNKLLETYKGFGDMKELIDVGGGVGHTVSMITAKYPSIKGINFDLPHVVEKAPSHSGVEHIGGDMLEGVPACENIFMKWVLHDWDDENCLVLLKNCYKVLPDHGKVIIVDSIQPAGVETNTAAKALCQVDVHMLTQCPGGKERTEEEFLTLVKAAGFARMNKVCYIYARNYWVIEAYKN